MFGFLIINLRPIYFLLGLPENIIHEIHAMKNSPWRPILALSTKFLCPTLLLFT